MAGEQKIYTFTKRNGSTEVFAGDKVGPLPEEEMSPEEISLVRNIAAAGVSDREANEAAEKQRIKENLEHLANAFRELGGMGDNINSL